jgi:undecaprenyl diphosphate synthase
MSSKLKTNINHIAIIMDGNGRWATARSHKRVWGHIRGTRVVSSIVEEATELGVKALTLYAFSTENWSRPLDEVTTLFNLLKKFLIFEKKRILKQKIQFKIIGDISKLPEDTKAIINELEDLTKNFDGLKLTFAFSYGGRSEIISSVNKFMANNPGKEITESDLSANLMNPITGDVDLMIRTGGDQRISNFLLWQVAYGELYFVDKKWPDFTAKDFRGIVEEVSLRERRFGTIESCESLESSQKIARDHLAILPKTRES